MTDLPTFDINGFIQAVTSFMAAPTWKAAVTIAGIILICLVYLTGFITKYLYDKNKRESDAYNEALRIKKIQETNLQKMQGDATQALIDNMDIAYEQDYEYYVKMIKSQTYKAVYAKVAVQFYDKIAEIIYREELTPEQRSAMIINIVRKK
jgi:hypothetical protein